MLHLPSQVTIEVSGADGRPLSHILVTLSVNVGGRNYFGTHVGLTDASGVASTTADRIRAEFALNRRTFVMDYKVPLEECDSIAVAVLGSDGFADAQKQALASSLTAPSAKDNWKAARNAGYVSQAIEVAVAGGAPVHLSLQLEPTSETPA